MSSVGNFTGLIIGSAEVSLTGGGIVTLSNNSQNIIEGTVAANVLTNVNNTIQGSGNIGNNQMGLVNQSAGIIDADQPNALTIQTSNGTTNAGTLEATNGANLILKGDTYTNTGGTILASGAGSIVTLFNPTIVGGTLNTARRRLDSSVGEPNAERRDHRQHGHLSIAQQQQHHAGWRHYQQRQHPTELRWQRHRFDPGRR
jgi:hypothetical protein